MIQIDTFSYHRVERPEHELPPEPGCIDVAVLDMNHGWHNLGHDAIVEHLHAMCDHLTAPLESAKLTVRVFSYDVRQSLVVPRPGRFQLLIGTGGPGHLDPRENDGVTPWSQGVHEDPSWEAPLYELFDSVLDDEQSAFFAICHTFGVVCRWAGIARPVLRTESKGGKSAGVVPNVLTSEAKTHPYYSRLTQRLPDQRQLRVTDNRLFDMIEEADTPANGFLRLSYESTSGGGAGDALTMIELARDREGVMPRFLGVNHHPEVIGRNRIRAVLTRKWERGEVTRDWYEDRLRTLEKHFSGEDDEMIRITSIFTFLSPVEFHLQRMVRERREAMGLEALVDENLVVLGSDAASRMTALTE